MTKIPMTTIPTNTIIKTTTITTIPPSQATTIMTTIIAHNKTINFTLDKCETCKEEIVGNLCIKCNENK